MTAAFHLSRAFRKFGSMTSGVGIQYAPSSLIDDSSSQQFAPGLPLGQRLPPQIVIREGDFRAYELQELCPSNNLFKVFIFTGDIKETPRMNSLQHFATAITSDDSVLKRFERKFGCTFVDVMCIVKGEKATANYFDIPSALRSHWTKCVVLTFVLLHVQPLTNFSMGIRVLLNTEDITETVGGTAYATYGIRPEGVVVVIRPDGHICLICGVDEPEKVEAFFGAFMIC